MYYFSIIITSFKLLPPKKPGTLFLIARRGQFSGDNMKLHNVKIECVPNHFKFSLPSLFF